MQGVLAVRTETFDANMDVKARLLLIWKNETERVYKDRLVTDKDMKKFDNILQLSVESVFEKKLIDLIEAG